MAAKVGSSVHPTGDEVSRQTTIQTFKDTEYPLNMTIYAGQGDITDYETVMEENKDF